MKRHATDEKHWQSSAVGGLGVPSERPGPDYRSATTAARGQAYLTTRTLGSLLVLLMLIGFSSGIRAQEGSCDCMDIVLVVDRTGDMKHVVHEIRRQAADITAAAAAAASDVRMGLVTFREGVFVEQDLTSLETGRRAVENAIGSIQASGGASFPENWDGALDHAANRGSGFFHDGGPCFRDGTLDSFRADCRKLVVLITDALPSGCNSQYEEGEDPEDPDRYENTRVSRIASDAAGNGVIVSTIQPLTENPDDQVFIPTVEALLRECATTTEDYYQVPIGGPEGALAIRDAINAHACPPAPPPPTVTIAAPQEGSAFGPGAVVDCTATAINHLGTDISSTINWFLNGQPVGVNTASISLDFSGNDGIHTISAQATDGNGTGNDAVTITVGASGNVKVFSITYATSGGPRGDKHLLASASLVDGTLNPVSDASVSIELFRNGNLDSAATGVTVTDGTVIFQRSNAPSGTYTTVITDVTAAGLTWDGDTPENSFTK